MLGDALLDFLDGHAAIVGSQDVVQDFLGGL